MEHAHKQVLETEVEAFIGVFEINRQKADHFLTGSTIREVQNQESGEENQQTF